jgi:TetR/AcrR family transcriptional regulator, regulator of cefoperazone and chloramphenicol sensitivity
MLWPMKRIARSRRASGRREDGAATKLQVLEAAGEVFAEKGIGHTTGKEIAERAGTNSAAVNYYFGGIDGLYAEVLLEAHHRLMDFEFLKKVAESPDPPAEKLKIFLEGVVRAILGPASSNWALRVLAREMLHPSEALQTLLEREVLPKKQLVVGFIAQIMGLPPDHPAVARCGLSIIGPIALLLVGSPEMLKHAAPSAAVSSQVDAVVNHFQRFVLGGLSAVASEFNQDRTALDS